MNPLQELILEQRRIEAAIAKDVRDAFPDMSVSESLQYAENALRDWGRP